MKKQTVFLFFTLCVVIGISLPLTAAEAASESMTKVMKRSLVYLETSSYSYEQYQPWKHTDISQRGGYACAVGKYSVVTTASNVKRAVFIKARRHGQNEFIAAKIKVVDYESNLCLIQLDANEMSQPLEPLKFFEDYKKGAKVKFYQLTSGGRLRSGRGYLDRKTTSKSAVSYARFLNYVVSNTSRQTSRGQVYCIGSKPIGIACWSNNNNEAGLIPSEIINKFLAETANDNYEGFGAIGFRTSELLDPAMRSFLKMPPSLKNGVLISDVYNLGTGSDVLKKQDIILAIDGKSLDPYGRFEHPKYKRMLFPHLITSKTVGNLVSFDLWRNGKELQVQAEVKNFKASEMLVPYYEFDQQPEYIITGGFILQKLTREYMSQRGDDWAGEVSPHLYHYYRDLSIKPTPERNDIVILSYVLPANINHGYQDLRQIVVKTYNGMTIRSIADILTAQKLNPDSKYDVIEFELDQPMVVINREQLPAANMLISKNYGIRKLVNVNP